MQDDCRELLVDDQTRDAKVSHEVKYWSSNRVLLRIYSVSSS